MLSIDIESFICTLEAIQNWHKIDDGHGHRVAAISIKIGRLLNGGEYLEKNKLKLLEYAARIHDIGRAGIDNHIMAKRGELTQSQYAAMKEHCQLGYDILKKSGLPYEITGTVLYHHEHWDGSGYPKGLKGLDIPLFSRIVLIADMYDGIISERPYHGGRRKEIALEEMNKHVMWFDPKLYALFLLVLRDER